MEYLVKTLCDIIEAGGNKRAVFAFCKAISKMRDYRGITKKLAEELNKRKFDVSIKNKAHDSSSEDQHAKSDVQKTLKTTQNKKREPKNKTFFELLDESKTIFRGRIQKSQRHQDIIENDNA